MKSVITDAHCCESINNGPKGQGETLNLFISGYLINDLLRNIYLKIIGPFHDLFRFAFRRLNSILLIPIVIPIPVPFTEKALLFSLNINLFYV